MNFLFRSLLFLLFFALSLNLNAQTLRPVLFVSGDHLPEQTPWLTGADFFLNTNEISDGWCFRLIQFSDIPKVEDKEALKKAGIELLNYIPYKKSGHRRNCHYHC